MKTTEGEIVQVQGGHIVRSTGRKDRHSKVYTAKGPRDRRVRLAAHTAIQFYDVQDRLGYDRPSKAVDWLMKKAKSAIDKLAELPPWNPLTEANALPDTEPNAGSREIQMAGQTESSPNNFQLHNQPDFMPPHIDSAAIDDTMKSFFPTSSTTSTIHFQSYPGDIISRTTNPTEDLGLSLHSFHDQGFIHGLSQGNTNQAPPNDQTLYAGSTPVGYDTNYQRLVTWSNESNADTNRGGFIFSVPSLLGQGSAFSQRGTLQSSFSPSSVRVWGDIPIAASDNHKTQPEQYPSIFGSRFLSDGLPAGYCFPTRVHEQEEDHAVSSDRPCPPPPSLS